MYVARGVKAGPRSTGRNNIDRHVEKHKKGAGYHKLFTRKSLQLWNLCEEYPLRLDNGRKSRGKVWRKGVRA
jgi:hypothetical protein